MPNNRQLPDADRIVIPYRYQPRQYQLGLFNFLSAGYRRACVIWHRRAGKDLTLFNLMVREACKRKAVYYYLFPSYRQGRRILWDGITSGGMRFIDHCPKQLRLSTNNTEMKITLFNGSIIQIVGSDNIDSIVGSNPYGCCFSEYSIQDPRGWEFVRPILRENGGWAAFLFTPRGYNHGYSLYQMARSNPAWYCELQTILDTQALSLDDIDQERAEGMSESLIEQEYYCSFQASVEGAYFAQQLTQARSSGRIGKVPFDPALPVETYWDLGVDDSTTLWFLQRLRTELHFIHYYENCGEDLLHYANYLKAWGRKNRTRFSRHVLPHDGQARSLHTGKTTVKLLRDYGIVCSTAPRPERKEFSIEAARQVFPYCWFDEAGCKRGIEALAQYRKEYDEINKVYKARPVHDWTCLAAGTMITTGTGEYPIEELIRYPFCEHRDHLPPGKVCRYSTDLNRRTTCPYQYDGCAQDILKVPSYDDRGNRIRNCAVDKVWQSGLAPSLIRITLSTGRILRCTSEHLLLTVHWKLIPDPNNRNLFKVIPRTAWVPADSILIGTQLKTEGTLDHVYPVTVEEIATETGSFPVYDICTQPYHNFFAEGVCVHNSHAADAFQTMALVQPIVKQKGLLRPGVDWTKTFTA